MKHNPISYFMYEKTINVEGEKITSEAVIDFEKVYQVVHNPTDKEVIVYFVNSENETRFFDGETSTSYSIGQRLLPQFLVYLEVKDKKYQRQHDLLGEESTVVLPEEEK